MIDWDQLLAFNATIAPFRDGYFICGGRQNDWIEPQTFGRKTDNPNQLKWLKIKWLKTITGYDGRVTDCILPLIRLVTLKVFLFCFHF